MNHNILNTVHLLVNFFLPPLTDYLFLPHLPSSNCPKCCEFHNLSIFKCVIKYHVCMYPLKPCYLSMVHRPGVLVSRGGLLEIQNLNPTPDLLNRNPHCNKIPCRFICTAVWGALYQIYFFLVFKIYFLIVSYFWI